MTKSKKLHILMLGPASIFWDDKPLRLQRRVSRAMLFFLAFSNRLVSRSHLVDLFWPEESEQDGRRHLREILSKLRKELPKPDLLITEQDGVRLDFSRTFVDALEFKAILERYSSIFLGQEYSTLPNSVFQQLSEVIKLWRSPHFMAGFKTPDSPEFEHWMVSTAEDLENSLLHILKLLSDHSALSGDIISSLYWLKRSLEYDPMDANLQHRYLLLLKQLGRIGEANHYYNNLVNLYRQEELGELPNSIQVLYRQIQSAANLPPRVRSFSWTSTLDLRIPYVGRKSYLQELQNAYQRGGTVILLGEAGSGKTRIMYELLRRLDPSARLIYAQGRSQESHLPFQPLIDSIRVSFTSVELGNLEPVWKNALSNIMPDFFVEERPITASVGALAEQGPTTIYKAIHQLLLLATKEQKLIFFLDDAQWCDDSSLGVISYLLQRGFFDTNGLLVIASRVEEENEHLQKMIRDIPRGIKSETCNLQQLEISDIQEMANSTLGFLPSDTLIQQLATDTGGNPLFLIETMHELLDTFTDSRSIQASNIFPIAKSIKTLINTRVRHLDTDSHMVLVTAAILGSTFSLSLLESASQVSSEEFVRAVEKLEKVHLIRSHVNGENATGYHFIHDKFREVLLQNMTPARKRLVHMRVAEVMEVRLKGVDQMASVIAQHYQAAGELQKAFDYWIIAGRYAGGLFSTDEADHCFTIAEKLMNCGEFKPSNDQVRDLYVLWAEAFVQTGSPPVLESIYKKLLVFGRRLNDAVAIGKGLNGMALVELWKVSPEKANDYITESLPYLDQVSMKKDLAAALNHQGLALMLLSRFDEAETAYKRSLTMCGNDPDPSMLSLKAETLARLSLFETYFANPVLIMDYAQASIHIEESRGPTYNQAWGYVYSSVASWLTDRYEEGLKFSRTGLEIAELIQNPAMVAYTSIQVATSAMLMGWLDTSWEALQRGFQIAFQNKLPEILSALYSVLAQFYLNLRDYPAALKAAKDGYECHNNNFRMYHNLLLFGLSQLFLGQFTEGMQKFDEVIQHGKKTGMNFILYPGHNCHAMGLTLSGDGKAAQPEMETVRTFCRSRGMWMQLAITDWLEGVQLVNDQQPARALHIFRKIAEESRQHSNPWQEMNALGEMIKVRQMLDEPPLAERERMIEILEFLDRHAVKREVRPLFEKFEKQMFS
jgi:predicted ATPase/DNA-binding SARP family transcriptional activator